MFNIKHAEVAQASEKHGRFVLAMKVFGTCMMAHALTKTLPAGAPRGNGFMPVEKFWLDHDCEMPIALKLLNEKAPTPSAPGIATKKK